MLEIGPLVYSRHTPSNIGLRPCDVRFDTLMIAFIASNVGVGP